MVRALCVLGLTYDRALYLRVKDCDFDALLEGELVDLFYACVVNVTGSYGIDVEDTLGCLDGLDGTVLDVVTRLETVRVRGSAEVRNCLCYKRAISVGGLRLDAFRLLYDFNDLIRLTAGRYAHADACDDTGDDARDLVSDRIASARTGDYAYDYAGADASAHILPATAETGGRYDARYREWDFWFRAWVFWLLMGDVHGCTTGVVGGWSVAVFCGG